MRSALRRALRTASTLSTVWFPKETAMADPADGTLTVTGVCNFLMPNDNVAVAGPVGSIVKKQTAKRGNWVGGRFELTGTEFRFSMNKLNAAFQKDTAAVTIPRSAIRKATKCRMMMFFSTVDLDTDIGSFRVRSTPKGTRNLLTALGAA
jgi:hypothetical protein